jgi:hypothetical protein
LDSLSDTEDARLFETLPVHPHPERALQVGYEKLVRSELDLDMFPGNVLVFQNDRTALVPTCSDRATAGFDFLDTFLLPLDMHSYQERRLGGRQELCRLRGPLRVGDYDSSAGVNVSGMLYRYAFENG